MVSPMPYLWFSTPVPVLIKTGQCQEISHVEEAAEILLYHWPKSAFGDLICLAAQKACHSALTGKGEIENARSTFEAAAREAGILRE
ncbi:MAG: hypothetical protein K0S56_4109 [Microvirga sp.]|jgi:hypothetical protein|nr:hypothetical protein [Microvirga sp.]